MHTNRGFRTIPVASAWLQQRVDGGTGSRGGGEEEEEK